MRFQNQQLFVMEKAAGPPDTALLILFSQKGGLCGSLDLGIIGNENVFIWASQFSSPVFRTLPHPALLFLYLQCTLCVIYVYLTIVCFILLMNCDCCYGAGGGLFNLGFMFTCAGSQGWNP